MGLGHADCDCRLVPARVPLGVRVGRGLPLASPLALALAMGTHARLGTASPVRVLAGELSLACMIAEFAGDICQI